MSYENKGSMPVSVLVTSEPDRSGNYTCNGTSDETEINLALRGLTTGRTWVETVKLVGDFTTDSVIFFDPYTILDLSEARITLANGANDNILQSNAPLAAGNIYIIGGILDGNRANQGAANIYALWLDGNNKTNFHIYDTVVFNVNGWALAFDAVGLLHMEGIQIYECDGGIYGKFYDSFIRNVSMGSIYEGGGGPASAAAEGVYLGSNTVDNIFEGCYFGGGAATNGGVYLHGARRNIFTDCICQDWWNGGYVFADSGAIYPRYNSIIGGICGDNSHDENNANIILGGHAHHNYIDDVIFEERTDSDKAAFAIEETGSAYSNIIGRNVYINQVTAPVNLLSVITKIPVYPYQPWMPAGGATEEIGSPIGVEVNLGGESCQFLGSIPEDVFQVVRLRVKGVALGAPGAGGQMHAEFTFNAGAMNAAYNTAVKSWNIANFDGEEADYVANDGVSWLIRDVDVGNELRNLAAGDTFELWLIHEAAEAPDEATNVRVRSLDIECV